ncbi:hypothetical protein U5A82_04100 [Sphingobium sp. CR2-8]|nr:hypothetical protein [Sphingobium sp. CR2-8]MEC3909674.1 hypothetical protein [Sphingobium sp. CR2-8]
MIDTIVENEIVLLNPAMRREGMQLDTKDQPRIMAALLRVAVEGQCPDQAMIDWKIIAT